MGCIASKQTVSVTPAFDHSGAFPDKSSSFVSSALHNRSSRSTTDVKTREGWNELEGSRRGSSHASFSSSYRLGNFTKYIEGEQVAAGWPSWLTAVAGEAIQGWIPLRADSYEKLEKIGQGTYSTVFRARDVETGAVVALKKVRFDNFDSESVRFMAREIQILRRLVHRNVVKLEGLIASKSSCSIYLVLEYMEHDLAGLSSSPDNQFTESQIKCYMQQLLLGLEHCHSCSIIHRDIKCSNLLVNNEGILKIADFGLANVCNPVQTQPLTSRVVTLWYRPPELLLGSTDYTTTVDLWSAGCVFAELLLGKPILQGRTEVEQLHKIFKLCGSPSEEYWKKSKLSHATMFKPQHQYGCCLGETFNGFSPPSLNLLETLLSVEPYKRGAASSALKSQYFASKPYACDPSTLPKYPPNKEIDAKTREEAQRKRDSSKARSSGRARRQAKVHRTSREDNSASLPVPQEPLVVGAQEHNKAQCPTQPTDQESRVVNTSEETYHAKHDSLGVVPFSGPLLPSSGGFTWIKNGKDNKPNTAINSKSCSKVLGSTEEDTSNLSILDEAVHVDTKLHDSTDTIKRCVRKQCEPPFQHPALFGGADLCKSQNISAKLPLKNESFARNYTLCKDEGERVEFSGPLLSQTIKVNEILQRNERHIRQVVRRSWFQKVAGLNQRE